MFSSDLQQKIDTLKESRSKISLGGINFASPLLLAPMSMICSAPYRLLMEELGAGGTISELVSCHGILHGNKRTRKMLSIDPRETNVGTQLFGEDTSSMAEAAKIAEEFGPKFIDINMGCPVRKVVTKGAGSALLKDPKKLSVFLREIKKAINIPLTIKIRTGWDEDSINADEVIKIAHEEGVEFVAVHGRTRAQAYKGFANWDYLENLAKTSPLPIIGNGDLHHANLIKDRVSKTACQALMLGRGPLRDPFIFLKSYDQKNKFNFYAKDYFEVITAMDKLLSEYHGEEFAGTVLIQLRKFILWFSAGYPGASKFREILFKCQEKEDTLNFCEDFFLSQADALKKIDYNSPFMTSGHG
jgi:nifR3 family TIM-barrel protein